MNKRVRMTLYRVHDYDLVRYYLSLRDKSLGNPKISFCGIMKGVLKKYILGEDFSAPQIKTYCEEKLPFKINVRFTFDCDKDAKIIQVLESLEDKQINSFLKSLIRRELGYNGLICYIKTEEAKTLVYRVKTFTENAVVVKTKPVVKTVIKPVPETHREETEEQTKPVNNNFDFFKSLGNINV